MNGEPRDWVGWSDTRPAARANIEAGTCFRKDESAKWKCSNCGYIHEGKDTPETCPACDHPQAYYELLAENW